MLAELFPVWEVRNGSRAAELNLPASVYIETHGGIGIGGPDDPPRGGLGRPLPGAPAPHPDARAPPPRPLSGRPPPRETPLPPRHDRNRPLLQTDDPLARLQALYEKRHPLYMQTADIVLDTGRQSVHCLVRKLEGVVGLARADDPAGAAVNAEAGDARAS